MEENSQQPPAASTQPQTPTQHPLKPHRGPTISVLGIVGLVLGTSGFLALGLLGVPACACGIIAWVMANKDLKQMAAGTMDPVGRGLTRAGKICGKIGAILGIVWIFVALVIFVI